MLIDCNIYHEYNTYANGEWDFYFVHFGSKYINLYKDFLLKKLTPIYLRNFDKVCQSMEMLNRLSFNNDKVSFLCESNLISDILTEMVLSINEVIKEKPSQIERLKDFISSNFRQDLHIEDFVEYISDGYECFVGDPQLLETKDQKLYNYFRRRGLR